MSLQQTSTSESTSDLNLIRTFLYSIRSKETQRMYLLYIKYFEKWHQKGITSLVLLHTKLIDEILIRYVISMRDKDLSSGSITARLSPIISFLDLNDITINQKKLRRFLGESKKTIKDEAYTHYDLVKMFSYAPFRTKLIISIFSSTGMRKAALLDLKLKHIEKIQGENI